MVWSQGRRPWSRPPPALDLQTETPSCGGRVVRAGQREQARQRLLRRVGDALGAPPDCCSRGEPDPVDGPCSDGSGERVRRTWIYRRRGPGRPPLESGDHVPHLQLTKENPRWGCTGIRGGLLKLRTQGCCMKPLLYPSGSPRGAPRRRASSSVAPEHSRHEAERFHDLIERRTALGPSERRGQYDTVSRRVLDQQIDELPNRFPA